MSGISDGTVTTTYHRNHSEDEVCNHPIFYGLHIPGTARNLKENDRKGSCRFRYQFAVPRAEDASESSRLSN